MTLLILKVQISKYNLNIVLIISISLKFKYMGRRPWLLLLPCCASEDVTGRVLPLKTRAADISL